MYSLPGTEVWIPTEAVKAASGSGDESGCDVVVCVGATDETPRARLAREQPGHAFNTVFFSRFGTLRGERVRWDKTQNKKMLSELHGHEFLLVFK